MIMKKILSIILTISILLTSQSYVYANNSITTTVDKDTDFNYLIKDDTCEVVEFNGFKYIYLELEDKVVTMTLDKENKFINGYINIYNSDDKLLEMVPSEDLYFEDIENCIQEIISIDDSNFIRLNNNMVEVKQYNSDEIISIDEDLQNSIKPLSVESDKAIQKAKNKYGASVYDSYLAKGTYNGKTGNLYYTRTFGAYKSIDKYIAVGVALTAISAFISLPLTAIKSVVAFTTGIGGALVSSKAEVVRKYVTTCYNKKEVKVGSIYPYRSLRDYVGDVLISSTGVSAFQYRKTNSNDNLYNNNQAIIKKGCDLY